MRECEPHASIEGEVAFSWRPAPRRLSAPCTTGALGGSRRARVLCVLGAASSRAPFSSVPVLKRGGCNPGATQGGASACTIFYLLPFGLARSDVILLRPVRDL